MAPHSHKKADVVVARSKRTHEKYPARVSHLQGSHGKPSSRTSSVHYTDRSRLRACRCPRAEDHEKPIPMSHEDRNLAIAITRYMNKFDVESCHQPDFYHYQERQKIQWALNEIRAERFHYLSKEKDIVCRCSRSEHLNCRRVHSPHVQELCAEFYGLNTSKTTCTREQWRKNEPKASKRNSICSSSSGNSNKTWETLSDQRRGSFEYDSPSVVSLLKGPEDRHPRHRKNDSRPDSIRRSDSGSCSRYSSKISYVPEDMAYLSSGSNGKADIPEVVWRASRPSVFLGQHNTESVMSTPLGSSVTPVRSGNSIASENQPAGLRSVPEIQGFDYFTDDFHRCPPHDLDPSWLNGSLTCLSPQRVTCSLRHGNDTLHSESDVTSLRMRPSELAASSTSESMSIPAVHSEDLAFQAVELPSAVVAAELDTTPIYSPPSHHSPTLRELEGNCSYHIKELTGRRQ